MHRDPTHVAVDEFDLASVNAASDLKSERLDGLTDREGALHCSRRPVERREEAVAERLDLFPAKSPDLTPNGFVVPIQEQPPLPVAELGCAPGGFDDVGEENRREHAV